jgi:hypothetical protein
VSYPVDDAGRYRFPMLAGDDIRVVADCHSCGWGMDGPERVWNWLAGQHAGAHNKGADGLSAVADMDVQRLPAHPEPEPEAGL